MSAIKQPAQWSTVAIEDCLLPYPNGKKVRQGWSPQCDGFPAQSHDDWGVLRTSAIQDGAFVESENKNLPKNLEPRPHLEVCAGDLLMTCAGPRSRCGVACLVRSTRPRLLISGKMYQLRVNPEVMEGAFLELFLRESSTQKKIDEMKTGISDSGLNLTHDRFKSLVVPRPPLPEQKRIVAKIEELFSELDAGEANLRLARKQLGVYRQALLKKAFEGRLTTQWRAQHSDLLESPSHLLARIQIEHEVCYEQQVKRWETAARKWAKEGMTDERPSKPRKPRPLRSLTAELKATLPALPDQWQWIHVDSCASPDPNAIKAGPFGSALKKQDYVSAGYKIYGQEQVISGDPFLGDYYIAEEKFKSLANCAIKPGDILISLVGTVGKVLVLPDNAAPGIINPRLVKITPSKFLVARFFQLYFESEFLKSLYKLETHGATMDVLNLRIIGGLPIPLCSFSEQQEIVRLLEAQFEAIQQNEREIDQALTRSGALRQAILKQAFLP